MGLGRRGLDLQRGVGEQDVAGEHNLAVQWRTQVTTQEDESCGQGIHALVHRCSQVVVMFFQGWC